MKTVSGNRSVALGIDTKVIALGKCNHPNKREVIKEFIGDGLPFPEFAWTHCVFYRPMNTGECMFAGNCEHRVVDK